ncbi:hypothetical protein JCM5350_008129 [Sporobolomyces pararoseus]
MSLYESVSTTAKRGSEALAGERPNKLTKKSRGVANEPARPVRPSLRRSGSTRSIFAGALDLFSRRSATMTAFETQDEEERAVGFEHEDEEEPVPRFRLRQMPSLLSLSSMIRGSSSKSSVPITPSPTATSFLSNNTTTDNLPALISPTESTFSTASQDTIVSISSFSAPVDLPFSPSFVRGEDEWDTSIGDSTMTSIDLQGSYTPVCYEGVFGKTVKKDHQSLRGSQDEREGFLSVF